MYLHEEKYPLLKLFLEDFQVYTYRTYNFFIFAMVLNQCIDTVDNISLISCKIIVCFPSTRRNRKKQE
jgi:hypothetical protein